MWLPGKLVSRMSQVFRRPNPEKNKKKNSKALDNGDASFASSSSDARSPGEGSLKKGSKERFRPPLVEGRAICDNNVLEYTAFPIRQLQQKKDVSEKASSANGSEDENLNERLKAEEKADDDKMGSPQIDRSPPAAAATALLAAGGGGGSGGAGSNNNSNTSSTSGRLQQPQQQQQPQEQVSPSTTNTNSENSRNQEEPEGEKLMNAFPQSDKPCSVFFMRKARVFALFSILSITRFFSSPRRKPENYGLRSASVRPSYTSGEERDRCQIRRRRCCLSKKKSATAFQRSISPFPSRALQSSQFLFCEKSMRFFHSTSLWTKNKSSFRLFPGSIDLTPSSEGSAPAYLRWAESIHTLLEDGDGVRLFKEYLAECSLVHYIDFWLICNGIKALSADKLAKAVNHIMKT